MPAELRGRLAEAATENRRSLTAEIIARLESTFDRYATEENLPERLEPLEDTIRRELDEFEARLRRLRTLAEKIEDAEWKKPADPATR